MSNQYTLSNVIDASGISGNGLYKVKLEAMADDGRFHVAVQNFTHAHDAAAFARGMRSLMDDCEVYLSPKEASPQPSADTPSPTDAPPDRSTPKPEPCDPLAPGGRLADAH